VILTRLDSVSRSYGGDPVLENTSLEVYAGRRLGVIGRNGAGKTTLLRLLAGRLEPDGGTVWRRPDSTVAMLDQVPDLEVEGLGPSTTVEAAAREVFRDVLMLGFEIDEIRQRLALGEAERGAGDVAVAAGEAAGDEGSLLARLGELEEEFHRRRGFEVDARVRSVLAGVGFASGDLAKPVSVLSGGEKGRLSLARVLLASPDLLLLDEPTNHLDLDAVEWLEGFLRSWEGGLLVISHDRLLLDRVTHETLDVTRHRVKQYPVPFTRAIAMRDEHRALQLKRYRLQQREIARQEDFIRRNIAGQKTIQAQARRRMLEKLERIEAPDGSESPTRVRIKPRHPSGFEALMAKGLGASVAGRTLFRDVELHVRRGDRLAIIGPNGSGKTTLLDLLSFRRSPETGSVTYGTGVEVGYLDQELNELNDASTVLGEIHALDPLLPQGAARSYLARFLFRGDAVFKQVRTLSGGERCRLALAKLFYDGPNLLFLDEPTNHLDIDGRTSLEAALAEFSGTVVAVSHDRYFLNRFAKQILELRNGVATPFLGTYDEFRAWRTGGTGAIESVVERTVSGGALRHEERKRVRRERERLARERERTRSRIAEIEAEIDRLDAEMSALVEEMAKPDQTPEGRRSSGDTHRALEARRAELYSEWGRLVESSVGEEEAGEADPPESGS
jgi:ATP-binding cassette subfamily F protein 3